MMTSKDWARDPITLQILWARLVTITEECWITLWRTAFSMIVGEAQDFGCELLDAHGESLAHSPRSMPVFNLTLPRAVQGLLEAFPPDTLRAGDVLATNDPWICAGHLNDVALVSPIFRRGSLVGLAGSIAHCSDIGGSRDALGVREIYDEGVQIPPMKLYREGEANRDVLRMIELNTRGGERVLGDLQAQLSANEVGSERLLSFLDEYALDDLGDLARVMQDHAERAMREAIAALPDGVYEDEMPCDAPGAGTFSLRVRVTVRGDDLDVEWIDVRPQVEQGGVNCTMSYTAAHSVYALKCLLTPDLPSNAGCYRPIDVQAPAGSILNCRYPAPVNARTMVGWYCGPAIVRALAPALPERVQSFTGMPMSIGAYGFDPAGHPYNDSLFQGGGQGASAHRDGKSALLFPTSARNTPVETFESRVPLLVERKELTPDSGGAGRQRGGLGQRVRVRKLHDDGLPVQISMMPTGVHTEPPGLQGGAAAPHAAIRYEGPDGDRGADELGGLVSLRSPAERLTLELSGGSGFGPPSERPVELVARDLAEGRITPAGLAAYGCRLGEDGQVRRH
ncbi:MAG: hydantoinase B/oxoprolinase family protein [Candidatus Dormiibacterota bacterium]